MTTLQNVLLFAHLLGMAAIIGGYAAVAKAPRAVPAMVWGARAQLLIGLAMVGVASSQSWELNHVWVAVKLLIAFVVVGLLEVAQSKEKKNEVAAPLVTGAAVLAVVNVAVAVFWH
ncbi:MULTISPECIES: hypothetical protein [Dermacoccus]|jgi:hypothetical protein|uniref:Integral membrane protein n=3 Tax=Dermacoccus TaxID=57495 RepID=A0A417Z601_9MICO|nr:MULTISPECIES: hypothetical protein [Dermacoccus]KLO62491.1 membrane protein [Dermacoccus sp. PE3]MBE7370787.1 hypothetical protein [Dermacoccus barathri]MBZ4496637.1 hypothetical protein [Dermacoccus sp. Tok2021]MCT1988103.1 hypothetical protein [Dermacoccus abyssi]QEH93839.1 hypothetical protein FV141_10070 [Dermacoccus abyssi]